MNKQQQTEIDISGLQTKPTPINEEVIVGKDILDLLTGSMYIDPLNIYREFIQNSADAIDLAKKNNLTFNEEPYIRFNLDHSKRTVKVRDNGISLNSSVFVSRIVAIGGSKKRGEKLRGFRGIGRLSGIGYCQKIIFRGKTENDKKVTEVLWDGKKLKELFRDPDYNGSLAELVKEITSVNRVSAENYPDRFFEVELQKISRLKNDLLMNEPVIKNYISQIGPLKLQTKFAQEIQDWLNLKGVQPPIKIEFPDSGDEIFHRLKEKITFTPKLEESISKIEFIDFKDSEENIVASGWFADHNYLGQIPKSNGIGGIRLRSGNIQIGSEDILSHLFPEPRFSNWAIGDIHILSHKIVPNGRRDEFESSNDYIHLLGEISILCKHITHKIRTTSSERNIHKNYNLRIKAVNELLTFNSENKLPNLFKKTILSISNDQIKEIIYELEQHKSDSKDFYPLLNEAIEIEKAAAFIMNKQKKIKTLNQNMDLTIEKTIKAIILNSRNNLTGLNLALEVYNVIIQ